MRPQSGPRVARIAVTLLVTAVVLAIARPPSALGAATPGFIGINAAGLYAADDATQEAQLSTMQSHGITVERQFFRWNYLEPARGVYSFENYDRFAIKAAQHNIRLQVMLGAE